MSPDLPSIVRLFGIELEFFLTDHEGNIANKADQVLRSIRNTLRHTEIKKECGHAMLEMMTLPHRSSREVYASFFRDFESLLYEVETQELGLFNYGTYPYKNTGEPRTEKRYGAITKVLGNRQIVHATKCIGFHYHWSLPRNSINPNILWFYPDITKSRTDKIVNLYNLYTALDPAITTFMQSSPYYEGEYIGKNSRTILYRGDSVFNYPDGRFAKHPEFGILNSYVNSFEEMKEEIKERALKWKAMLKEKNMTYRDFSKKKPSYLDSSWKPVKISTHATVESRGADMNSLNNVVALSNVLKTVSKFVQNKKITVQASDIGNEEPFTLEDNILHVPNTTYLREVLQKEAAVLGFESKNVHNYCKALLKLIKKNSIPELQAPLRVFSKMVSEKSSTSDKILSFVKKKQGYTSTQQIEKDTAQYLALHCAESLYKDLILTKKMCDFNLVF